MTSIEELKHLLLSPQAPAIVEAPLELVLDPGLSAGLQSEGYFAALVDRAPVFDKPTLMHALYQSCQLPAYFGFNWDALYDLLCAADQGWVLIFKDFPLLEERAPKEAEVLKQIVEDAASVRRGAAVKPIHLLIGLEQD
jgi:RNAse (barnase) inhibitor barstar